MSSFNNYNTPGKHIVLNTTPLYDSQKYCCSTQFHSPRLVSVLSQPICCDLIIMRIVMCAISAYLLRSNNYAHSYVCYLSLSVAI